MTRLAAALLAVALLACGHYGPPRRHAEPAPVPQAQAPAHTHDASCDHPEEQP